MKYVVIFLSTICILTYADSSHYEEESNRFPMDLHDLKLTAKQHKSVESAMKEYRIAYRNNHRTHKKMEEESYALFISPTFNPAEFASKEAKIQEGIIEVRAQLFSRLHAILTPEQRRLFITHMKEWEIE